MTDSSRARWKWASAVLIAALLISGYTMSTLGAASTRIDPAQAPHSVFFTGGLQNPDSLNPFVAVLSASYLIFSHVYDLLVGIGPGLTPVPQLAKSWSVSDDGLTWTFNLQENVVWHDDRPFTSRDVKFTYEYIQSCKLSLFLGYVGDPSDPGPDGQFGTADDPVFIQEITTPDDRTVVMKTNKPKANMASLFVFILPEHIWSTVSCQFAKQGFKNDPPIGTGMYKFVEWRRGQYVRFLLNEKYYLLQPGKDYVDEKYHLFYNSVSSLHAALIAGRIDATGSLSPDLFLNLPADIDSGTSNPDADPDPDIRKFVVDDIVIAELGFCSATDAMIESYGVSGNRHWLSLNVTIRRAVANAMNKTSLLDTIWGGVDQASPTKERLVLATPGSSLIPPATPFWHYNVTAEEELVYDMQLAAARLSDPAGDGAPTVDGQPPDPLGSNLDPNAPNNRDAFADINKDGIREVIDINYVASQNPEAAPKANRAVRGSSPEKLLFGWWIINYDVEGLKTADLLIPELRKIGIAVEKKVVSEGQQLAASYACDFDWYTWGWGFDVDPDFALSVMTTDQILAWQDAWYSNATYDQWYLEQQQKVDMKERQEIVHAMQKLLYRDQPYNVLWYPKTAVVVRADRFTNWGDWSAQPGLGLTGFGNVFLFLQLEPVTGAANQCPTSVQIERPATLPRIVFVGEAASFAGTAFDTEGDALNWTWDWKDGARTQVDTAAGVTTVTVSHAWSVPNDYNITLTVTDNLCGASTTSAPLWVNVTAAPAEVGWIVGTVTDAGTNAPLSGATITVSPGGRSTVSGADGTYNISVAPGSYQVTASKLLYAPQTKSAEVVAEQETEVDFALRAERGWIVGTVTDASTGAALEGVALKAVSSEGREFPASTDADGGYNITVPPGTYDVVVVEAVGYVDQTREDVAVADGQEVVVNFALQPVPRPTGLGPLGLAAAIGLPAVIIIAIAAFLIVRKRRKASMPPSDIGGPPRPPAP